jgi:hypothetical protein
VRHEAQVARANGELDAVREYDVVDRSFVPTVSRAEVLADLEIWRRSGMAALDRGEAGFNAVGAEYRQAHARYAAMRSSPQFAELVQSYARKRGEVDLIAAGR